MELQADQPISLAQLTRRNSLKGKTRMPRYKKFDGKWTLIHPAEYATPMDRRNAMRRRLAYVAWFATFAGLGVLLAWRF